jgi:kynureninase
MDYQPEMHFARWLDAEDPLRCLRDAFCLPTAADGSPLIYFCGHSLGPQPRAARPLVERELDDWGRLAVDAHFRAQDPWYTYADLFREPGARLVGARPGEVVMMNSLTVNLHLMLATFYRPSKSRFRIVHDVPTFPSDNYALQSVVRMHGLEPAETLVPVRPREGDQCVQEDAVESAVHGHGDSVALLLFSAVQFVTGQWFDVPRLTAAAHRVGAVAGFDLAHAAGNVPLALHDWGVDFAVWCNYKYVSAGPGAVGGCFVHENHGQNLTLARLAGWWGNDPATRFDMDLQTSFIPRAGAEGWQVSNPSILAMAPLRASLDIFDEAGMGALRAKSELLTGYLEYLLDRVAAGRWKQITPRQPGRRGCALSLALPNRAREVHQALARRGAVCDFRPPNVLRIAPVPLYNTFSEVWTFATWLSEIAGGP